MLNRKETPLPTEPCTIRIKQGAHTFLCAWNPYKKENYPNPHIFHPAKGYLGTASVIEKHFKGIGFHAWEQNEYEFIYYEIIKE